MNRIKVLSDSVKRKIAAGEVIEGPFSVVKELLENSIDADADEIDIEVYDSGLKKIKIRDNGSGIYAHDLPLAIEDHATSKIENITDIEDILSYGFRGEALSSISSVSKIMILTRAGDDSIGAKLTASDSSVEILDYAGPAGTTVIVENLFYNVPARKKFLKKKNTELRYIREIFLKIALAKPEISFAFTVDGKRQITLTRADTLDKRIEQIYGKEILQNLYFDRIKDIKVEVTGYLSKPEFLKSSRSMQFIYVNNRIIDYRYFGVLLSRAYEAVAVRGRHPVAFLFISIDPALVDVNIHPTKREVKFFDQQYVDSLIIHLAKKALGERIHRIDDRFFREDTNSADSGKDINSISKNAQSSENRLPFYGNDISRRGASHGAFVREVSGLYREIGKGNDVRILGLVFDTYILAEDGDSIVFIDFHAAHERFIFDSLMKEDFVSEIQELIFPETVELPIGDLNIARECMPIFDKIGFDIEEFSDNSLLIRGVPGIFRNLNIKEFIQEIVESVKSDINIHDNLKKRVFERAACHAAKRSHDTLTEEDRLFIVKEALYGGHELRCPHGRPYVYNVGKTDLERIFKRS